MDVVLKTTVGCSIFLPKLSVLAGFKPSASLSVAECFTVVLSPLTLSAILSWRQKRLLPDQMDTFHEIRGGGGHIGVKCQHKT